MKETIKLFKKDGAWFALFSEPEVKELMGTDTIQTPFLDSMPSDTVLREIKNLNPQCEVSIQS